MNRIMVAIGIITIVIPIIGSMLRGEIFCDSAYYICHAQLVSQGKVPYYDFCFGYTPLWLYIAAFIKIVFGIPDGNYVVYLLLHYLFLLGSAFLVYKIALAWNVSKTKALFGSWLFMIMSHWLQGNVLLLEPPSIFFGLLSSYLIIRINNDKSNDREHFKDFLAGLICVCSFLSKQFGLVFFFLNLFLIIVNRRQTVIRVLCFVFGYMLPMLLCFLYWRTEFMAVVFSGYGTKSAQAAGWEITILERVFSVAWYYGYFVVWVCPLAIVGLFSFPNAIRQHRIKEAVFCYCGIIGFSLQFWFAKDFHYLLYMIPFGVLLMLQMWSVKDGKWLQKIKYAVVVWTMVLSMYKTYKCRVYKWYIAKNVRKEQLMIAKEFDSKIAKGASLWVEDGGLTYLYLTTGALPPNLKSIGFSFGPLGVDKEKALVQAKSADFVAMYSNGVNYEDVKHYLESYPAVPIGDSSVLLYDMRSNK